MLIARQGDAVVVQAPAKVNLFLEILARRSDGYHDIATLMMAVSLYDTLEFTKEDGDSIRLICDDDSLPVGPENLICRAAEKLRGFAGGRLGARIHLSKRIPMAAGLAGGSTDAAATLAGLNLLWDLGRSTDELARLGEEVGSDVPFFFSTPAAWCTGRGEKVEKVVPGRPIWLVIACPPVGLATAEVYRNGVVPLAPLDGGPIRRAFVAGDIDGVGRLLHNRLQEAADLLRPGLRKVKETLARSKPAGTQMSGSGTSCFALCRDRQEAFRVVDGLPRDQKKAELGRVYIVRSCV